MAHPAPEQIEIGIKKHRHTVARDGIAVGRRQKSPASGGQDARRPFHQAGQHLALAVPKERLSVAFKDFGDGHLGGFDNGGVAVHEGHTQHIREHSAHGGFARSHHAHKGHCLAQFACQGFGTFLPR